MKIQLSGLAAEKLKLETLDYSGIKDVENLLKDLSKQNSELEKKQLYVSVNEDLASENLAFNEADEVLVFNVFAGG